MAGGGDPVSKRYSTCNAQFPVHGIKATNESALIDSYLTDSPISPDNDSGGKSTFRVTSLWLPYRRATIIHNMKNI